MLLAAHTLQRKLKKARSRIAEEDGPLASAAVAIPASPPPLDPASALPTATSILLGFAPPATVHFNVDPLDQCTALGIFLEAGGDVEDPHCKLTADALWHALQRHLAIGAGATALVSGFRPSNKTRRAERRTWQLLLARTAAAEGGVSWDAFERCWFDMELGRHECPASQSESSAVARLSGRPVTPPHSSAPSRSPAGLSLPPMKAAVDVGTTRLPPTLEESVNGTWHTATAALEVQAGIDTLPSTELRQRSERICQSHQRVLNRIRSVNSSNPDFPPQLAHLLRLDARRLQGLLGKLVKRFPQMNPWLRALKRCVDLLALHPDRAARGTPALLSATTSFTTSTTPLMAAPSPPRAAHVSQPRHRAERLPVSSPKGAETSQLGTSPRQRRRTRAMVEADAAAAELQWRRPSPRKYVPAPPSPTAIVESIFHRAQRRGLIGSVL